MSFNFTIQLKHTDKTNHELGHCVVIPSFAWAVTWDFFLCLSAILIFFKYFISTFTFRVVCIIISFFLSWYVFFSYIVLLFIWHLFVPPTRLLVSLTTKDDVTWLVKWLSIISLNALLWKYPQHCCITLYINLTCYSSFFTLFNEGTPHNCTNKICMFCANYFHLIWL